MATLMLDTNLSQSCCVSEIKKETNHNFLPALSSDSPPSPTRFLLQAVLIRSVPHSVLRCHFTQPEQTRRLNQSHFLPTSTAFIFCCFGCRHRSPRPCETSRHRHCPPPLPPTLWMRVDGCGAAWPPASFYLQLMAADLLDEAGEEERPVES